MKVENNRPHGTGQLGRHGINESCVIATLMPLGCIDDHDKNIPMVMRFVAFLVLN